MYQLAKCLQNSFGITSPLKLLFYFRCSRMSETKMVLARSICKLESPEFQSIVTPELLTVASAFEKRGYDLRVVGGAVRDLLLGNKPKDVDLSTNATPEKMIELFDEEQIRYIETGLQHGTLTVHLGQQDFEITTLRIDVATDGRHAKVEFTDDWKLDAERRDLTFNAMSLTLDGTLYDYFGGRDDLIDRRVRFVGDPLKRLQEDYLRILRYFRFYGRIAEKSDEHDKETLDIISQCVEGLDRIAVERIWVEVSKILVGKHAPSLLRHIYELKVAEHIGLPSYTEETLREFDRAWHEHQKSELHPATLLFSLVDGASQAELLAKNWKLSNSEKVLGRFIVTYREPITHENPLKPYQDMLVCVSTSRSLKIVQEHVIELLHYQGRHVMAEQIAAWVPPEFPITGKHLKEVGVTPGPEFGRVLNQVKETWKESYYKLTKDDLLEKLKQILKN